MGGDLLVCIEVISVSVSLILHDEGWTQDSESSRHDNFLKISDQQTKSEGKRWFELEERCTENPRKKVRDFASDSGSGPNPLSTL